MKELRSDSLEAKLLMAIRDGDSNGDSNGNGSGNGDGNGNGGGNG